MARTRDYTATTTNPTTGETQTISGTHTNAGVGHPHADHRVIKAELAKQGIEATSVQVGPARIS
ncbi:hypothetical protein [Streptomyces europaeiscabiei]|uniref:hypothetical protein n=1 Tax=Streptomyces europaeiscabiei TaxID=146819 RepID=UPI002E259FF5|nr:hypothetical protein OG858_47980 [Streptomyces europaeiscabiei]